MQADHFTLRGLSCDKLAQFAKGRHCLSKSVTRADIAMFKRLFVDLLVRNKKQATITFLLVLAAFYAGELQKTHEDLRVLVAVAPFALCFAALVTMLIFIPMWVLVVRKEARSKGATIRAFVLSPAYDQLLAGYSKELNKNKR